MSLTSVSTMPLVNCAFQLAGEQPVGYAPGHLRPLLHFSNAISAGCPSPGECQNFLSTGTESSHDIALEAMLPVQEPPRRIERLLRGAEYICATAPLKLRRRGTLSQVRSPAAFCRVAFAYIFRGWI